jgi:putative glutamine amidotransferase
MAAVARPVIGCTIELADSMLGEVEPSLRRPLEDFGAVTIVFPRQTPVDRIDQLLDMVDGIQLSGGWDVHPSHYGEERHELTEPAHELEDAFELEVTRRALDRGMPVMGICRGIQVLAVAGGGKLTQDVETMHEGALHHRRSWTALALDPPGDHWHRVVTTPGSAADRWLAGGEPAVNSFHHQCVADPGPRFVATARSEDGVIEAIERVDGRGWAAGMQWHNELMWRHDERFLRPFGDLVEAAAAHAAGRGGSPNPRPAGV